MSYTLNVLSVYDIPLLLHRIIHHMDRAADRALRSELGISHRRAIALLVLDGHGSMSQRALAGVLGHSEAAVSGTVRELVDLDAVTLEAVDGRERRVVVTESGRRLVRAARAITEPMFAAVIASTGVDATMLGEQLSRLDAGMGAKR